MPGGETYISTFLDLSTLVSGLPGGSVDCHINTSVVAEIYWTGHNFEITAASEYVVTVNDSTLLSGQPTVITSGSKIVMGGIPFYFLLPTQRLESAAVRVMESCRNAVPLIPKDEVRGWTRDRVCRKRCKRLRQ